MRVKKSTRGGLSGGGYPVGFSLSLKKGVAYHECCCEKNVVLACVF